MIVVYKEIKNGKVELTQEELEELLEKARKEGYNEGYKDGQNAFYESHRYQTIPDITYPSIPAYPVNPIGWDKATIGINGEK